MRTVQGDDTGKHGFLTSVYGVGTMCLNTQVLFTGQEGNLPLDAPNRPPMPTLTFLIERKEEKKLCYSCFVSQQKVCFVHSRGAENAIMTSFLIKLDPPLI